MQKKRHILHVVGGLDRGGAETFLMNVARNLDRSKYKMTILTFLDYRVLSDRYVHQDELEALGIETIRIKDTRFSNPFKFVKNIANAIKVSGADVVHSHIDFMSALPLIAARKSGVDKRIAHSHCTSNAKLTNPLNRMVALVLKQAVSYLSTDRVACGEAAGRWLFGKKAFTVIDNAIDLGKYLFNSRSRAEIRKEHSIKERDVVLLNVGRLELAKNQGFLIKVLSDFLETLPSAKLFIVGQGDEEDSLKADAKTLGVENNVIILATDEVDKYYSAADIFVMPSLYEGLPFAAVEAQASGLASFFSRSISDEVAITARVSFLSLEDGASAWAKSLLARVGGGDLRNRKIDDREFVKYDIKYAIRKLESIYE